MKKVTYLLAAAMVCAACNNGQTGYNITGNVENAVDGEKVYLQKVENRDLVALDSAVIKNGAFSFKGRQDTAVNRYLTYQANQDNGIAVDFFLENGNIKADLAKGESSVTGTTNNDIYQAIKTEINAEARKMQELYTSLSDASLTDEAREELIDKLEDVQENILHIAEKGITNNITNAVGIHLLKQNYYSMEFEDLAALMPQIPASYDNDEDVVRIKEHVSRLQATGIGKKFTDFEMQTPEGKKVQLSDYVGKGKVVLVDFWASWCGPCRREMPNLVELYKQYKGKKFEIIGVSLDRDAEAWKNGIKQLGITWPQMSDLKYWNCAGAKLYAVNSIPHTVLIDAEGVIIARGLHGEELQEKVAEALGK